MHELVTWISIILGVASITLSVTAIIIAWVTHRNSAKIQLEAQRILAKVAEKIDVVVTHTTQQINKAWDFFTAPQLNKQSSTNEAQNTQEKLIKNQMEELRQETMSELKRILNEETGMGKKELDKLSDKVEALMAGNSERAVKLLLKKEYLRSLDQFEDFLSIFFTSEGYERGTMSVINWILEKYKDDLTPGRRADLEGLITFKEKIDGNEEVREEELREAIDLIEGWTNILGELIRREKQK